MTENHWSEEENKCAECDWLLKGRVSTQPVLKNGEVAQYFVD